MLKKWLYVALCRSLYALSVGTFMSLFDQCDFNVGQLKVTILPGVKFDHIFPKEQFR